MTQAAPLPDHLPLTPADEAIVFAEENAEDTCDRPDGTEAPPWLILVVDDEPDVHSMTALILSDVRYRNRPLKLLDAYSVAEALSLLEHFPDIAVALIDVVMEADHAGLHLIRAIRGELGNREIRLILRTGQPGQAPQRQVIVDYDINDYRSKAELSADDLFITVVSALRSYEHIIAIETRVTERTRELLDSRERLRTILESSPVGVGAINAEGQLTFTNLRFAELFAEQPDSLIGADLLNLLAEPADRKRYGEAIAQQQPIRDSEIQLCRADGSSFWALLAGDPRTLERETSYLFWIHDISRLKQTENDLNTAKNQAEQATRAKSAFLATMSHEIRTPMNGVLGMLELLERSPLDPEQTSTVSTIRESSTALLRIIDDILDFSKIEAEKLVLETVPMSLTAIVEGVAETLAPSAWRKELELLTFVDPEIPQVLIGDPLRLRQILFNFAGNAIKFTEHGRVILMVELVGLESLPAPRAKVVMKVIDSGIGIALDAQSTLFQPYAQAEQSTARRFGGTGLGLSICRRLAEMMGGSIAVTSEPQSGSTFAFDVSLECVDDGSAANRPEPPLLAGLSVAVAIADDLARDLLARYLRAAGARVVSVTDGHALLNSAHVALAAGRPFDAAVLDGRLYQSSVVPVREALGLGPAGFAIPAVLIAQRGGEGKIRRTRASDASLTVIKPVRRTVLVRAVAMATGRIAPDPAQNPGRRASDQQAARPSEPPSPYTTNPRTSLDARPSVGITPDRPRVLVAEDNAINRRVISMQLGTFGLNVEIVEDGKQALEALQNKTYDLLLTDCHMPELDGFELTRQIRAKEQESGNRRLPIIAFTANAFEGEAERFRAAGMDDYLCKPLQIGRLGAALQRWLPTGLLDTTEAAAPAPAATPAPMPGPMREPMREPMPESVPTPAPPLATSPAVDLTAMTELCGDDPALIREMLGDFVKVSRQICLELADAVRQRQAPSVRHCAHNLKGSSRTAGARSLAEVSRQLENAADSGDWNAVTGLAGQVQSEMDRVADTVEAL